MTIRRVLLVLAVLVGVLVLALIAFVATFDANRYKPQLTALVENYTGRKLTMAGDLDLSLWPRLSLSMGEAALSDADGEGEAARFDSGRVAVALRPLLSRTLVIEGLTLNGLRANLGGSGAAAGAGAPASAAPASAAPVAPAWRLEGATLKTGRIASGQPDRLSLDGRILSPDMDIDLALTLASRYLADFGARTLRLDELDAAVQSAAAGATKLSARLAANVVADLAAQRAEASALALEATAPDGLRLALAGTGKVAFQEGTADVALSGRLEESKVQVHVNATRLTPLALRYELSADRIDVDRLREKVAQAFPSASEKPTAAAPAPAAPVAAQAAPTAAPAAGPSSAAPPSPPLGALSPIAAVDTQGTLQVQRLLVSGLTFDGLNASARSGSGQVAIDPLGAHVNGGALQGQLSISANGPRVAAKLSGVDAGALIRDAARRQVIEGRGDVQIDLSADGPDPDAWTRSLAGTASFALRDGSVKGIDLSRVMQQVRDALGGRVALEDRAKAIENTPFSALTGAFRLAGGVAHTDNLDLRADWLRATGAGQANLVAQSLDLLIRATVTGLPGGTPENAAIRDVVAKLQGVTVPVHVSGRFDDLHYKVEVKDLAADAVKRELTRRLGEQLGVPIPGAAPGGQRSPGGKSPDPLDRLRQLLKPR